VIAAAATSWLLWSAVLVVATAFVALYCGLETGVYVLNKIRLDLRAEGGSRSARRLRRMLRRPNSLLAVLLIGTNLSSYAATFAVTAMFVLAETGPMAQWYALAVTTPLLFIFGDSVPKDVFHRLAETLTYRLSWVLAASKLLFQVTGLAPLVEGVTWLVMWPIRGRTSAADERLSAVFAEGRASGVLTHTQSVMADRVMHIGEVTLADAMVPMDAVTWIRRSISRDDLLELVRKTSFTRLPVRDEAGAVVGVLDVYDVLTDESATAPATKITEPLLLPAAMSVPDGLYRMQRAHKMLAVVTAGGSPAGIVTIKDLVEEIVGDLEAW
jgi:putative hemolysin